MSYSMYKFYNKISNTITSYLFLQIFKNLTFLKFISLYRRSILVTYIVDAYYYLSLDFKYQFRFKKSKLKYYSIW